MERLRLEEAFSEKNRRDSREGEHVKVKMEGLKKGRLLITFSQVTTYSVFPLKDFSERSSSLDDGGNKNERERGKTRY